MKKHLLILLSILFSFKIAAQTEPVYSTDGNETWYYIQFQNGGAVLEDMGDNAKLLTKAAAKTDNQLWKVVGTKTSCTITSKNGRSIYYEGGRFGTSSTKKATLNLYSTTNASYKPAWEIQQEAGQSMNQWGGAGINKELGQWSANDVNNPLLFVSPKDIEIRGEEPKILKEYAYSSVGTKFAPEEMLTLWYKDPVTASTVTNPWMEFALPIGNGQFGGMIYGGIHQDRVQFNDKTLWTGSNKIRGAYQNFGCLYLENLDSIFSTETTLKGVKNYYRSLNLQNATGEVNYASPDLAIKYKKEYITSYPDQCIAIRLTASENGKINQKFYMYNPNGKETVYEDGAGVYYGKFQLVSYYAKMKVIPIGGTMTTDDTGITVKEADEVMIILAGGTNFNPAQLSYIDDASTLASKITERVDNAAKKTWTEIYDAHVKDYQAFFNRSKLTIEGAENTYDTKALVDRYNNTSINRTGKEPSSLMLELLYYNYGRYLLISSSRGVELPANLQGIWNNSANPPWQSDIHSNINVQMNYWPAESTNLSELHKPFLNYIYNMAIVHDEWKTYAKNSGQTKGWTCYTQNNIFGHSDFMENYVIANAWYCTHLWQHYRYTLDKDFLKNVAFPVMKSCTEYWMERLIQDRRVKDGTWVCPDEWSPEHGPGKEDATAHSQQLTWDLFNNTLHAIEALGDDAGVTPEFVTSLKDKFKNLDTGLHTEIVDGKTLLREWKYSSYSAGERRHRHMSHLICLYPGSQLSGTNEYFQPAVNSLLDRGDASTGWSMGWKINLWARALDGAHAHKILKAALKHSTSYGTDQSQGGIYYNLFDSHAPFQIDGNFGACSGVAEMLLQSHTDTIQILPALPPVWVKGSAVGLRTTNNFEVDQYWDNGKAEYAVIHSGSGATCAIKYPNIDKAIVKDASDNEVSATVVNSNTITFPTKAGEKYTVHINDPVGIGTVSANNSSFKIEVQGNKVMILGNGFEKVDIVEANGAKIATMSKASFELPNTNGKVYILSIHKQGNKMVESAKISF